MRFRSGLLIGIFGLIVVLLGGWVFALATALLTYLASLEFFRMAEFKGIKPATKTTLFSSFIIIISTYFESIGLLEGEISNSILPICSVGICTWLLLQPKSGTISDIAASIFGLFYLGFLPSYWIKLRGLESMIKSSYQGFISFENLSNTTGLHLTLTSCFLIVASDIGSYFIGKSFGKTSLSPISPSKTIEGLIGGISCSIVLAIFFAFLLNWDYPLLIGILYGILISLMALVGDLIESMMKRDAKIKDSGTFLPGHGGILDRIDSYIFTPSVLYYIFILIRYLN
ncbi:phosphatidate cytidylyltransferase [Prochlorococcus marinus str. MU1402]|uniref:phosphatidate cytidylyltransferase n=1 Tax=Prochlorococcus marinus TaxID=1219 RepID=UPI001ADC2BF2|nr:phosphatidate cytidylyltransferase [Prochlorococcus marinus]MBO8232181.1 phosphatidate cytidylyltransferase [Prochlorococcus marinus XMU1402]MBW3056917.1 phosphatidate cytidylyltransferase [Prochlorococcus marinus str. MU1402]